MIFALSTDDGFSGVLYIYRGTVANTNTSDMSTRVKSIDTFTNVNVSIESQQAATQIVKKVVSTKPKHHTGTF